MKISLTEEIDKIKRLYTFQKGDTFLLEQGPKAMKALGRTNSTNPFKSKNEPKKELPGPNYYQIQSFLEEKTGIDTGSPGFGNKTAEALGVYLYGDSNTIKNTEDLSINLTKLGFDTKGTDFGSEYADSVSQIIKYVEGNSTNILKLLENNDTKNIIKDIINESIESKLPYSEQFKIEDVVTKKPHSDIPNEAWNKLKRVDVRYEIEGIEITDFNLKDKTLNGNVTGEVRFFNTDFKIVGVTELSFEIVNNKYLDIKIENCDISTKYKWWDWLVDFGFNLDKNSVKFQFGINLFPDIGIFDIGKGYTKYGPYYYNTPIESEIKKVKIPRLDIFEHQGEFRKEILKNI